MIEVKFNLMEEEPVKKGRIYSRFKSLPSLTSDDEEKLNKIIKRVSLEKRHQKRKTMNETNQILQFNKFIKSNSAEPAFFMRRSFRELSKEEQDSILEESIVDSVFTDDSQQFSYSFVSTVHFESAIEQAKTRVLVEDSNSKREELYFARNEVFLNLLKAEGSEKDIYTAVYIINSKRKQDQPKVNYNADTLLNSSQKCFTPSSNITVEGPINKRIRLMEVKNYDDDTRKIYDLDKKKYISYKDQNTISSLNDSVLANNGNFVLYPKRKRSMELIIDDDKIITVPLEKPYSRRSLSQRKKSKSRILKDYSSVLYYFKEKNKKTFETSLLNIINNTDTFIDLNKSKKDFSVMTEHVKRILTYKFSKVSPSCESVKTDISRPSDNIKRYKESLEKRKEELIDHMREKKTEQKYFEIDKEKIRGGRIAFIPNMKLNLPIDLKVNKKFLIKFINSIILIQRSWRYYNGLKNISAMKIQARFRGFSLRNKIRSISYFYFLSSAKFATMERILSRKLISKSFTRLVNFRNNLVKQKIIRCRVMLRRGYRAFYENETEKILFNKLDEKAENKIVNNKRFIKADLKIAMPAESIIVECDNIHDNEGIMTQKKEGRSVNENTQPIFRSKRISKAIQPIIKPNIEPETLTKKVFNTLRLIIFLQSQVKSLLRKLRNRLALKNSYRNRLAPTNIGKFYVSGLVNKFATKIERLFKNRRKRTTMKIRPYSVKKTIFLTKNSLKKLFYEYFIRKIKQDIVKSFSFQVGNLEKIFPFSVSKVSSVNIAHLAALRLQRKWKNTEKQKYQFIQVPQIMYRPITRVETFNKYYRENLASAADLLKKLIKSKIQMKKGVTLKKAPVGNNNFMSKVSMIRKILPITTSCESSYPQQAQKICNRYFIIPRSFRKIIVADKEYSHRKAHFIETVFKRLMRKNYFTTVGSTEFKHCHFNLKKIIVRLLSKYSNNLESYFRKWNSKTQRWRFIKLTCRIQRVLVRYLREIRRRKACMKLVEGVSKIFRKWFVFLRSIPKIRVSMILKIQRKFKCKLQQARKKLEKQKLLSIVLKKIRTNLGKIRYYFISWIDKKDIIKQIKALLIIKRALKKNKVLSIHRRKTFSLFNDFSEKIRNFFKMHLISIMYTIDSNQYKLNKANLFLNKIKFFHIYRTLHLLCSSSVRQNRLVSLYQFYDRKHCSSSMEKYFSKWRDQLRKEKSKQTFYIHLNHAKLQRIFRKKVLSSHIENIKSAGKRLRAVDLIYTADAMMVQSIRRRVLSELIYIKRESEQFLHAKKIFQELYKEMHLSYLKTIEEYDILNDCYGEITREESFIVTESDEDKIKFKYGWKRNSRPKESENWWNEHQITPSN